MIIDNKIKIGVLAPSFDETAGGGYTYVEAVKVALLRLSSQNEYSFLDFNKVLDWGNNKQDANFNPNSNSISDIVNYYLDAHGFAALWILAPLGSPLYLNIPYAITVWDIAHRYYPYFPEIAQSGWNLKSREEYYNIMLSRAAIIFTGNKRGEIEIQSNYSVATEKISILPLPTPEINKFGRLRDPVNNKQKLIFYPAQFWAHKNHINLIHSLFLLKNIYRLDVKLLLTGADHGNKKYVKNTVSDLDLCNDVDFIGFVENSRLVDIYRSADAMVYLSLFGPDNLPPLEAFSFGCPVIASDHPGHRAQLGSAALFVDPLDPYAIAGRIYEVLTNEDMRGRLILAGSAIAKERSISSHLKKACFHLENIAKLRKLWSQEARNVEL